MQEEAQKKSNFQSFHCTQKVKIEKIYKGKTFRICVKKCERENNTSIYSEEKKCIYKYLK